MNFEETVETICTIPTKHSILIIGPHGLGKSDAVREAGKIRAVPVTDQRLSQCDVGDMKGMPFCIDGRTYFAPPTWFPLRDEDAKELREKCNLTDSAVLKCAPAGILLLDEIDRATREVQQAAFELALDHRLNMRYLPEEWQVISAINADGDVYHVNEMDPAFIDRFIVINFNPTKEEWFRFAKKDSRIHTSVIDFLTRNEKLMDPTKEIIETNPGKKLYSRRSYEKLSECIIGHEQKFSEGKVNYSLLDKSQKGLSMITLIAQGYLGTIAGLAFRNFVESEYQSLDGDAILNKWNKEIEKKVQHLVDTKKMIELGSYNQMIINYVEKNKKKLSAAQSKNLLRYIQIIPNEVLGDFWKTFKSGETLEVAMEWYNNSSERPEIVKRIVQALANPLTGKGAKAQA